MRELLVRLGKRIHDLRVGKGWSQEEFAHVCGIHRTYAGQVERGEKNISFSNLLKISATLGVAASELPSGVEGSVPASKSKYRAPGNAKITPERQMIEIKRLLRRLIDQRTEMDRTILLLQDTVAKSQGTQPKTRTGREK